MNLTKEQMRIAGKISKLASMLFGACAEDDGFCEVKRTPKGNITINSYSPRGELIIRIHQQREQP